MPYRHRFVSRKWEWLFATYTVWFGIQLARPGEGFNAVTLKPLLDVLPEEIWAMAFTAIGTAHCIALAINGSAWWTPHLRTGAACFNFIAYMLVALGIGVANNQSSGLPTYTWLVMGGLGFIIFSAFTDALNVTKAKRYARKP